jgi:predicted transcriptional regulator
MKQQPTQDKEQVIMKYDEYDKLEVTGKDKDNLIINTLKQRPKQVKEIAEELEIKKSHISPRFRLLIKRGILTKKRDKAITLFGLSKEYR